MLVPGEEAETSTRERMAAQRLVPGGFIVVHAPASLAYKYWPIERTAGLIEQLVKGGERVVLTGAPDDYSARAEAARRRTVANLSST